MDKRRLKRLRFKRDSDTTMGPYCLFIEDGTKLKSQENDLFVLIKEGEEIIIERFGNAKMMTSEIVLVKKVYKNEEGIWTIDYERNDRN